MIRVYFCYEDKIYLIDYRENNKWTVYIHISPSNKYYVGITSQNVNDRWRNGFGYKENEYFWRAIQKYGWNNFKHEIFAEHLTKDEACNMEITLIKKLNSTDYKYGYNISSGGDCGKSGVPTSDLQKEVTSKRMKEMWENEDYRKKATKFLRDLHDEKWRKNQSNRIKEKWNDPDFREKHAKWYRENSEEIKKNNSFYDIKYGGENPNAKKLFY